METKRPTKLEIGKDIKAIRKSLGLTQIELAEIIEINRATLASWEIGKNEVPATVYKQITMLVPH